jgi:hypothetical protein
VNGGLVGIGSNAGINPGRFIAITAPTVVGVNRIIIVGNSVLGACAETDGNNIAISRVYYPENMGQAQFALKQTNGTPTDSLLQAIGEGIGNNAAHEIGHQLRNRFLRFGIVGRPCRS